MRSLISQISIHKLEVFCQVAELQSVSRAAERLGIAQPVVSSHMRTLSEKLGVPLTQRVGRRLVLTGEGKRMYAWAHDVVARTHELERELAETHRGTVGQANVGASMTLGSYVLPALISRFHERHQEGEISVRVATPVLVTDSVQAGDCDFAFSILDPRHGTSGLDVRPVGEERLLLVASQAVAPGLSRIDPAGLDELPFVTAQFGTPRREIEEYGLRRHGVTRRRIEMEFGHAEAIKQAVRAGAGAAFLFEASVQDELASGTLRVIETPGLHLDVPVYRVQRRDKTLSRFQLRLMQYLTRGLKVLHANRLGR